MHDDRIGHQDSEANGINQAADQGADQVDHDPERGLQMLIPSVTNIAAGVAQPIVPAHVPIQTTMHVPA